MMMQRAANPKIDLQQPGSLPVLSGSRTSLLFKLMDTSLGVNEVTREISQSSTIVARLIGLANSAWSTSAAPVTTLDTATTRLGLKVVRSVSIAMTVGSSFDPSGCPEFDRRRFWLSSVIAADTAALLAPTFDVNAATASIAGLLHNLGLLWLAHSMPQECSTALARHASEPESSLDELLRNSCGQGYRQAGFTLLTHWSMPEQLTQTMLTDTAPPQAAHHAMRDTVRSAAYVAGLICNQQQDLDLPTWLQHKDQIISLWEAQQEKLTRHEMLVSLLT